MKIIPCHRFIITTAIALVVAGPVLAERQVPRWVDFPDGRIQKDVGFSEKLCGLAVHKRALSPGEISHIQKTQSRIPLSDLP